MLFRRILLLTLLTTATLRDPAVAGERPRDSEEKRVTVMTRNLYLGADLAPAIGAILSGDPDQVPPAVSELWAHVVATDFPTRATALAEEIDAAGADLVGLQEAVLWRSEYPVHGIEVDATHVEYDFVELLLRALAARGDRYEVVAVSTGFDVEAPRIRSLSPLELEDIRLTDRVVILARASSARGKLILSNPQVGSFRTNVSFAGITILYGWASVDVKFRGEKFRFVTTHLESDFDAVRTAQGGELLAGPLQTPLPVVLAGDLNSNANGDATSTAYFNLIGAGFIDGWGENHPGSVVNTCCQAPSLLNPTPFPDPFGRIDHVLLRGDFRVVGSWITGADPGDRIHGLWPSDHAGVVVTLQFRSGGEGKDKDSRN